MTSAELSNQEDFDKLLDEAVETEKAAKEQTVLKNTASATTEAQTSAGPTPQEESQHTTTQTPLETEKTSATTAASSEKTKTAPRASTLTLAKVSPWKQGQAAPYNVSLSIASPLEEIESLSVDGTKQLENPPKQPEKNEAGKTDTAPDSAGVGTQAQPDEAPLSPTDTFTQDLTLFAWPPSFLDERFAEQNSMFLNWWSDSPENAKPLLSLLIAFSQIPDYSQQDIIYIIVREIGKYICNCASAAKPKELEKALRLWEQVLLAGHHKIQIRIPTIGASVDSSWMKSTMSLGTVESIYSWAVYNSRGIVYAAEVE